MLGRLPDRCRAAQFAARLYKILSVQNIAAVVALIPSGILKMANRAFPLYIAIR